MLKAREAALIMCGFPTCKFAFSPKSVYVPEINTQYLSKINSKKDSVSWRDLVTPVLPDCVQTIRESIGLVPVGEQSPVHNIKHTSGSSGTPTPELRLKMQMGSIPIHPICTKLKAQREKQLEE